MIYIGIDNGVSGTIGVIEENGKVVDFIKTPIITEQSCTKTKKNISRLNYNIFFSFIKNIAEQYSNECRIFMERPLINSTRFDATISAVRCLEAQLIAIEQLDLFKDYVDSKCWQSTLLPSGIKGSPELKKASKDIGIRKFPQFKELINKHGDADGILITEYARLKKL